MRIKLILLIPCALCLIQFIPVSNVHAQALTPTPNPLCNTDDVCWPMAGANPERTSWTPEEVRGDTNILWYRSIQPYINYKFQIITAEGKLFISTAKGLVALSASDGSLLWTYATPMPLGNSPTYYQGTLYVPGFDKKIYAVSASNGQPVPGWQYFTSTVNGQTYPAAGFETNPLIVNDPLNPSANNTLYVGNRDGNLYALNAATGSLKWTFATGGPILFSPAYKDNTIYFASNDSYAYAVNASTGTLVWQSSKLLGNGFYSYWPVVYTEPVTHQDYVIFSGSQNFTMYGPGINLNNPTLFSLDIAGIFPGYANGQGSNTPSVIWPTGHEPYVWNANTLTVDVSTITNYYETNPDHRVVFVLNRQTGREFSFDTDTDGQLEYAPFNWAGTTHSGNKYPPLISGQDGVYYQFANYVANNWISRGQIAGWKFGSHFISQVTNESSAADEPMAFSGGGKLIYWSLCGDRASGSFDTTLTPEPSTGHSQHWYYFNYNLRNLAPGYQPDYWGNDNNGWGLYGNVNGIYGKHGDQNPPIPYQGKIFMQKGNTIFAFIPGSATVNHLPVVTIPEAAPANPPVSNNELITRLNQEVQKIVDAGHLKPGDHTTSFFDVFDCVDQNRNDFVSLEGCSDYFHNPADTLVTLINTLPYLSPELTLKTRNYLQSEFANFPLDTVAYTGWSAGSFRNNYTVPAELQPYYSRSSQSSVTSAPWTFPPYSFYGAWKYTATFGNAHNLFDSLKTKLSPVPADAVLIKYPYHLNSYLAGLYGYLKLEQLAGDTTNITLSSHYPLYTRLLSLRSSQFTKDTPYYVAQENSDWATNLDYNRTLNVARNFMYFTPEVGQYLQSTIRSQVLAATNEYSNVAPYWFVTKYNATTGEGVLDVLFNSPALFLAKAYILGANREELAKYLDVPAFARGDLFYLQNLVAAIEAPSSGNTPLQADFNSDGVVDYRDFFTFLPHFGSTTSGYNLTGSSMIDIFDFNNLIKLIFK